MKGAALAFFAGGSLCVELERPRWLLGAQTAGLYIGVPRQPEPERVKSPAVNSSDDGDRQIVESNNSSDYNRVVNKPSSSNEKETATVRHVTYHSSMEEEVCTRHAPGKCLDSTEEDEP